jgi:hypothetical protein
MKEYGTRYSGAENKPEARIVKNGTEALVKTYRGELLLLLTTFGCRGY